MQTSKLPTTILNSIVLCFESNAKGLEETNQVHFPKPL
jgi:hypothetical protein